MSLLFNYSSLDVAIFIFRESMKNHIACVDLKKKNCRVYDFPKSSE